MLADADQSTYMLCEKGGPGITAEWCCVLDQAKNSSSHSAVKNNDMFCTSKASNTNVTQG